MKNLLPYDGLVQDVDDTSNPRIDAQALLRQLIELLPWRVETAKVFGREYFTPRMTAWFGPFGYSYSGISHEARPMPPLLDGLRRRAEELASNSFNSVLCNLYRNGGDSVGWHSDDEASLGKCPVIAGLSLGETRLLQFRHKKTKEIVAHELTAGHWVIMRGSTQHCWQHQVPKTPVCVGPRINLTFRRMFDFNS